MRKKYNLKSTPEKSHEKVVNWDPQNLEKYCFRIEGSAISRKFHVQAGSDLGEPHTVFFEMFGDLAPPNESKR